MLEQIHAAVDNASEASTTINDGATVDVLDARRITPLHTAVKYSGEASVLLLLEYGADPNAVNQKGETPLLRIRGVIQQNCIYQNWPQNSTTGCPKVLSNLCSKVR